MSDRRPPKLYVDTTEATDLSDNHRFTEATPADLLAVVRRGVESGTIKGEVMEEVWQIGPDPLHRFHIEVPGPGTYLVIPVSDGGSET